MRKSSIHAIRFGLTFRTINFSAIRCVCIVLKAELKLMKRVLAYVLGVSRWFKIVSKNIKTASSVLLFALDDLANPFHRCGFAIVDVQWWETLSFGNKSVDEIELIHRGKLTW